VRWLRSIALILTLIVAGSLAALSVNQHEIALTFAIWQTPFVLSMFWWLLAAFLLGLFVGMVNAAWIGIRRRLEVRRLRVALEQANAELERLRSVTIEG
jgi:uncharacterized membrane protein YciS (DUF1049 family)